MTYLQLETDLDAALSDGALLATHSIQSGLQYLIQAQNYEPSAVRSIVNELLVELGAAPEHVAGTGYLQ